MQIKLRDLLKKREALAQLVTKELPARTSFRLAKAVVIVDEAIGNYDKLNNELITKLGKPTDAGAYEIAANTPELEQYITEIDPVLDEELSLDITPVALADLGEAKIETKYMIPLLNFIITE